MNKLKKIISDFQNKKILIFGDLMLDEHIWSKINRISPEAPVPIADVVRINHVPGGCGNVAANISALGGIPILVSIIGQDSSGLKLQKALTHASISTDNIIVDPKRPTILKSRIIADSQHVIRVDREDGTPLTNKLAQKILKKLNKFIPVSDIVIISDYGKGSVTKEISQYIINLSKKFNKLVLIDPKGSDYSKYKRTTIITPNINEVNSAVNMLIVDDASAAKAGRKLLKITDANYILITRGNDGMSLISKEEAIHIPVVPREVYDITGAGDTVISTLSMALSSGTKTIDAVNLANIAASIVVGKIGTAPCHREELEEALEDSESIVKKIKLRKEIEFIAKKLRNDNLKIVFTNGCFDILHLGHVRYLKEAKKLGDILIVGLNSDSSVKSLKGNDRPYVPEMERAEILASLVCVDYVVIFKEIRPDNLIKVIKADFHVKGGDYSISELPEHKLVASLRGKTVIIPQIKGKSTTNIIKKIITSKKS